MATYTVASAKHATLTANTVDVINLGSAQHVEVINRDSSGDIYVTIGTTVPTVAGDNTFYVGPGAARILNTPDPPVIRLISSTACAYSVTTD
jgi:hypothetical protein